MRDIYLRIEEQEDTYTVVASEGQRKQFHFAFGLTTICTAVFCVACWVGICWGFVWAATGGWRLFHHGVDLIRGLFQ